jgi:hypothetical protein
MFYRDDIAYRAIAREQNSWLKPTIEWFK